MSTADAREQFLVDTIDRAIDGLKQVKLRAPWAGVEPDDLDPVIELLNAGRVEADGGVEP